MSKPSVNSERSLTLLKEDKKKNLVCEFCGILFSRRSNLSRHKRLLHGVNRKGEKVQKKDYVCPTCSKVFLRLENLNQHIKNVHSSIIEHICDKCGFCTKYAGSFNRHKLKHEKDNFATVGTLLLKQFECLQCQKKFTTRALLRIHERKIHNAPSKAIHCLPKKCPLCPFSSSAKGTNEILLHFQDVHKIDLQYETHRFASYDDFLTWKKEVEKKTWSSYSNAKKISKISERKLLFKCHRSGFSTKKGKNQRRLKLLGSCKINGFCPSLMKTSSWTHGVEVTFLKTHVGHTNDLKYLRLTAEDKLTVLKQLENDVPVDEILENINESSISEKEIQRIHLLKKKDIINLTYRYNLHQRNKISQKSLQDIGNSKDTSLFIYKGEGVVNVGLPHLGKEDFLLIYMSSKQKSVLENRIDVKQNTVCVDSNHLFTLHGQNFYLVMILALNEAREGFPVAFMITNRYNEKVLATFFDEVKQVSGPIDCEVLMTDLGDVSYTTWQRIMGMPKSRVFCSWNVLTNWRESVNRSIKNIQQREVTFNKLQTLLHERNEDSALRIVSTLISEEEDEDTKYFFNYFNEEFMLTRQFSSWAFCKGKNAEINESMLCDDLVRSLKFSYVKAEKNQNSDQTLITMLNIIRKKLINLNIDVKLAKLHRKLQITVRSHQSSTKIDCKVEEIVRNCWIVASLKAPSKCYAVERISNNCFNCQLQCLRCNTCVHEFICSCKNYAVDNNFCEHIHIVAQAAGVPSEIKEKPQDEDEGEMVTTDFDGNDADHIADHISVDESLEDNYSAFDGQLKGNKVDVQVEVVKDTIQTLKEQNACSLTLNYEKSEFAEKISRFLNNSIKSKEEFNAFKKGVENLMERKPEELMSHGAAPNSSLPFMLPLGIPLILMKLPPNTTIDDLTLKNVQSNMDTRKESPNETISKEKKT